MFRRLRLYLRTKKLSSLINLNRLTKDLYLFHGKNFARKQKLRFLESNQSSLTAIEANLYGLLNDEDKRLFLTWLFRRWLWAVSYTHLTLPTSCVQCRSRWSPYH